VYPGPQCRVAARLSRVLRGPRSEPGYMQDSQAKRSLAQRSPPQSPSATRVPEAPVPRCDTANARVPGAQCRVATRLTRVYPGPQCRVATRLTRVLRGPRSERSEPGDMQDSQAKRSLAQRSPPPRKVPARRVYPGPQCRVAARLSRVLRGPRSERSEPGDMQDS
jgi:hypothetical protein